MATRKNGLPLNRHQVIGGQLHRMREELIHLVVEVGGAYPFSGERSRGYMHLKRALHEMDLARSALEDLMFKEYGDAGSTRVYYPGGKADSGETG